MTNRDTRLARLRDKLRVRGGALPHHAAKLARAALNDVDAAIAHADCLAALPAYVDAEMDNVNLAQKFPAVQHHLATCNECATQYAELLELALAEQAGTIPVLTKIPQPDLSFLAPFPEFVKQKAAAILAALAPEQLNDLAVIADAFFERVRAVGGTFALQTLAEPTLGLGGGEPDEALLTLAVTYAATDALRQSFTPAEIDALVAQKRLSAEIESRARQAARALNIEAKLADRIAAQFARAVSADPAALRAVIAVR